MSNYSYVITCKFLNGSMEQDLLKHSLLLTTMSYFLCILMLQREMPQLKKTHHNKQTKKTKPPKANKNTTTNLF